MGNSIYASKINMKIISRVITFLYIAGLIPMLIIAYYNYPSADDYSMALEVHQTYVSTGNFFAAIAKAVYMGWWYFMNWTGYYFSSALTSLAPSAFNERLYFLGTFIVLFVLTMGVKSFINVILHKMLGIDKYTSRSISMLTLFIIVQCMMSGTSRNEAFYWYSGAINYMFMFGVALLWLSFLIKIVISDYSGKRSREMIDVSGAGVLGFLLGGANYMTALSLCIIMFSFFVIFLDIKKGLLKKAFMLPDRYGLGLKRIFIPAALQFAGFMCSVLAPGNSVRSESLSTVNPIKAIFMSFFYVYEYMLGNWIRWDIILLLAVIFIFVKMSAKKIAATTDFEFCHPVIFTVFCFGLSAANITPPIFATGNIESGRILSIFWSQFILLVVADMIYICIWYEKRGKLLFCENEKEKKLYEDASKIKNTTDNYLVSKGTAYFLGIIAMFWIFGSVLSVHVDYNYYTGTSALVDILNGNAATYARENAKRLEILKDDSIKDVNLDEFTVQPQLLFFSDVTTDTSDWVNKAVAEYYNKDSVVLKKADSEENEEQSANE
ncbi:MAG: DUF6056 family protein [Butyrivibrio sp.]|nr:DUF6056 family protein [Butyrivibrio sp.]